MGTRLAGALLALVVALTCSACSIFNGPFGGSSGPIAVTTIRVRSLPPAAVHPLPLSRRGSGSQSLGSFVLPPWINVKATCVGKGQFEVEFIAAHGSDGMAAACQNSMRKLTLNSGSNVGTAGVNRVKVVAPAGMRWHLTILSRIPRR